MAGWRKICCAIDFSPPSIAALEAAAMLARSLEASLTILHVGRDPAAEAIVGSPELFEAERRARDHKLEEWRDRARMLSGRPVTVVVAQGDPAAQITRIATEEKFDLVALGTQGRTGLRRTFLGSVAESVVRHAPCAVLTLHAQEEKPPR